jgi:hypothetical protein
LGFAAAAACATDDYTFVKDPKAEHCSNGIADPDLGETDKDCGGDCQACGLGQGCAENVDCSEGQCIEGFCQAAGCDNGALDEGETGVDCGGMCKPCEAGGPCDGPSDCASKVCTDGYCVAPSCDDGIINGTETGRDCGGGLCDGCGTGSPCNEAVDCNSGVCNGEAGAKKCEVSCVEGTAECDGVTTTTADECETNTLTDVAHCGGCGVACDLAHAEQSCVSGRCQIGACTSPYDDCDNDVETGCETNLRNDALHCDGCGNECSDQNGTPSCVSRECQIDCDDGFFDCNNSRDDGCEQNIGTDVLNCGECGNECGFEEGETPFCAAGECGATVCPAGRGNCDGRGDDCEKDLTNDVMNCGRCGGECTVFRGMPNCGDDGCGVESCDDGWANCNTADPDGGYMNGCETNTNVDPMNCGACGRTCATPHGTGTCVAGECRVMGCDAGWTNCDEDNSDGGFANGCETNTAADKLNCGVCERNCDTVLASANATGRCAAGICQRDQCLANFGDCDTNPNNCESDFRTDEGDCGNCDTACVATGTNAQGNECVSGTCTPRCDATHANCDTMGPNGCEINTSTDNLHCGGCNMPCPAGRACSGGTCLCTGGLTSCSGTCVNTTNNNTHCGACGNTCTGGRTCVNSVCQCPSGQTFCGGVCVDAQTDEMNCGQCGRMCTTPTGTTSNTCMAGVCVPVCGALRDSCDMEPWDGCEENLASNNANCGACGRACQTGASAHVTANTCNAGGTCVATCATGWDSCDMEPWDGCETDITSVTNCGQCGRDCAGDACGTTGSTSCCVATGGALNCQSTITTVNSVQGSVVGARLDASTGTAPLGAIPNHNLQAGTNRIVVLAVASETGGGGNQASRPDTVTYGGTNMLAGPVQFDTSSEFWAPDIYLYYLTDASGLSGTGNRAIVIDGNPNTPYAGQPGLMIAYLVQFNGVKQTSPFGTDARGFTLNDSIAGVNNVALTGSRILSFAAGLWPGTLNAAVTVSSGTAPSANSLLPSTADLSGGGTIMRAAAVSLGAGSSTSLPPITGTGYTVTWSTGSQSLAQVSAVLLPASQ